MQSKSKGISAQFSKSLKIEQSSGEDQALCNDHRQSPSDRGLLPSAEASPDEVRDFISKILRNKRGLSHEEAQCVATLWTIGRGRELRSYTPSIYLDIFGKQTGWALYHDIKLALTQEENTIARRSSICG